MLKVGINGFGRIGRTAFKIALDKFSDRIEIVAVNDLGDAQTLTHLLKYDSNYGVWKHEVSSTDEYIIVDKKRYKVLNEKDPSNLPWKDLGVDVVIESTGRFTDKAGAVQHIQAGAKKVIISAPAKGDGAAVNTYLLGVNGDKYSGEEVISNSSCTTNCIAPVAKVINERFGILKAMMTTVHAYTQDQNLQDGPHKDLRRARGAAQNIIPTSTGAAVSTAHVIPELEGKFDGTSMRVPVPVGSISDFTFLLSKKVTKDEINKALKEASESTQYKGILAVTNEPIVSSDIVGRPESAIVDLPLTQVVDGDLVKIFAWYDNEYGYSNRLIEQVINVGTAA
ncbi:MAG: Glyceraldehyde-3-phosphate dehydrogenase [Microgenomates group bacterium Gr01-1014_7]|nr:MAG: Glyceraldehyde-3-phosphate dehydrogenase [Microgenomates group bacterium Gr01-1014_7]